MGLNRTYNPSQRGTYRILNMENYNLESQNSPVQIQPQPPTEPTPPLTPPPTAGKPLKKYILAAILVILIIATGVFAYTYFFPKVETSEETTPLQNSLSENTSEPENRAEMEELEEIVEELKDTYPEEAPPSLNLTIPAESEEAETEEVSGKIAR